MIEGPGRLAGKLEVLLLVLANRDMRASVSTWGGGRASFACVGSIKGRQRPPLFVQSKRGGKENNSGGVVSGVKKGFRSINRSVSWIVSNSSWGVVNRVGCFAMQSMSVKREARSRSRKREREGGGGGREMMKGALCGERTKKENTQLVKEDISRL